MLLELVPVPCNKKAVFCASGRAGGRGVNPDAKQHHGAYIHVRKATASPLQAESQLAQSKPIAM
jgi:hypothetical protein